ncbi:MAG: ParB/RepB/Spo0J family partition protein [Candidatus Dadabacteria bacterium]|nr:ParB/RepB/Spo0J family partition protein [Candidatus Dadabacteria bacterium]MCZ6555323.1 ParB/RepB/Spo0J family partition protein [Candidatus Dadabacteria bacterium]MCZ6638509.1 ParB/RepB/Spo0J family partition protein [Candidatus Dadabacteria bacterium]MCZ6686015.1 ParB/RepB/Spo0J family partition protein [Candidatus Dadabacteria bacterium]MCZ6791550.1 ParB/RepB/Spo0J family partition protein [Candidatus Dadabacteria bacterium]
MKKYNLGRGLDALIPKGDNLEGYIVASINELKPNMFQPRKDFDDETISELASSIKEKGILQPLVVRTISGGYEIIAGERRWRAAQRAGITRVPVIIKEATDREVLELALIENLQREDLNPIEEAVAYQQLIDEFELTHEDVSRQIGKDRSTITNQLRLLKLPEEAKKALIAGDITAGHARAILSIESSAEAREALKAIQKQKLSVRKTEQLIQNISKRKKKDAKPRSDDIYIRQITDELKKSLSTQVRIVDKQGKGKIEIDYYSNEELERLTSILKANSY